MHNWRWISIGRILAGGAANQPAVSWTKVYPGRNEARASAPGFTLGNVAIYRSSCRCREQDWGTGSISTNLTLSLPFQSPKTFLRSGVAQLDLSTDRAGRFSPVKKQSRAFVHLCLLRNTIVVVAFDERFFRNCTISYRACAANGKKNL